MVFSGAWGKLIHEKNQKQKILWHCPFKLCVLIPIRNIRAKLPKSSQGTGTVIKKNLIEAPILFCTRIHMTHVK